MLSRVTYSIWCVLTVFAGDRTSAGPSWHGHAPASPYHDSQQLLEDGIGPIELLAAAPPRSGSQLSRLGWTITCDGQQNDRCTSTIDGKGWTFWTSEDNSKPHTFTIDLKSTQKVNALAYSAASAGLITAHKIFVSTSLPTDANLGELVAYGTWYTDTSVKFSIFEAVQGRYVTLQSVPDPNGRPSSLSIQQINIWSDPAAVSPPQGLGKWGPTIVFPLVPAGAWVDPGSKTVVTFSSFIHDSFNQGGTENKTLTATWNGISQTVSQRKVSETYHDMFCPGMSFDAYGSMVITGGETADKVSVYNQTLKNWFQLPPMNINRGYQGQTTCADGRIFVIGGSWGPERRFQQWGDRTGEIYNPNNRSWTLLPGCPPDKIQTTQDWEQGYRDDNHVWLLGWKKNSVFQAGPSQRMNWIDTAWPGKITPAGKRGTSGFLDNDAMCGVATMYDATNGLILTTGGAPSYKYWDDDGGERNNGGCFIPGAGDSKQVTQCIIKGKPSTANAFIVQLGEPNRPVNVTTAGGGRMKYSRIFHHAVVLPDGNIFVVGGQQYGQGFTDQTPRLTPELFTPSSSGGSWQDLAPNSIVRVYHSFALLLPDATVLVGGSGLCGGCNVNHLDAQIYTPQYLRSGAARPAIRSGPITGVYPGSTITVTTDKQVSTASLIRYSGATHSLNNDQRRIPFVLSTKSISAPYSYTLNIPPDGGIAIPGYWMLFVVDSKGVPSEALNIQILVAK